MSAKQYKARSVQKRYRENRDGHIAVVTALVGLPLLLMVSIALDLGNASAKRANIRAGADAAALASVIPANLSDDERAAFAKRAFVENYFGKEKVDLAVKATREQVDIEAHIQVPTLLSSMIGKDHIDVRERSSAIVTRADVVCVLALDPKGDRAIEFLDNAKFNSPECSVQANSTSSLAINSEVVTPPVAKSFCTSGVSRGRFSPLVKHACTPIVDPYANLIPPADGPCLDMTALGIKGGRVINNTVLIPGTYCGSLTIDGTNITMLPGTYIMKDKSLWIKNGSQLTGKGVTIAFKGQNAIVEIESGSSVDLTGPATGPYKGLVFYQTKEGLRANHNLPSSTSTIIGGSSLKLTGTAYFPTQKLVITSDKPVAAQAPATALIAYNLQFGGQSVTEIHVDHETAGLPPLLPRSDEGARLIE
ncbi:MAG: hypothetical protein EX271_02775 [Acidimicrobiales bacterium]|nr:hypothetical protein [Hyphomonadaceae bacterium]RZV43987.1 MAG: hypothetical protein EX271_02775 [Acidimicrobiales bacterium]